MAPASGVRIEGNPMTRTIKTVCQHCHGQGRTWSDEAHRYVACATCCGSGLEARFESPSAMCWLAGSRSLHELAARLSILAEQADNAGANAVIADEREPANLASVEAMCWAAASQALQLVLRHGGTARGGKVEAPQGVKLFG